MPYLRHIALSMFASGALFTGALLSSPAANAAETPGEGTASLELTQRLDTITPAEIDQAINEALEGGYVKAQTENADGSRTTTLDFGHGFEFDIT